jgi:hypothetical protein
MSKDTRNKDTSKQIQKVDNSQLPIYEIGHTCKLPKLFFQLLLQEAGLEECVPVQPVPKMMTNCSTNHGGYMHRGVAALLSVVTTRTIQGVGAGTTLQS